MQNDVTLEELASPDSTVTIRGTVYPVRPIDGFGMQLIHSTPASDRVAMIRAMYRIAARCLGLPFDTVYGTEDVPGFSESEVMEVAEVAQKQVKKVEATVPNDSSAGAVTSGPNPPHSPDSHRPTL